MILQPEILRPEAKALFKVLSQSTELEGLTLIGGTALTLQIGHRVGLDFDFAQFGGNLPGFKIDQLIGRLKQERHQAQMITSPAQISQFKINRGMNLLDQTRDYVIDGVKVTFFVHSKNKAQQEFYQSAETVIADGMSFTLLGLDGLKVSKTLVLADRVRSRDLYDLYILIRDHNYTPEQLFTNVKKLGTGDDPEHYKAIMRGEIPLDEDDEGLETIELNASYEPMYNYFKQVIDEYEIKLATEFFS